MKRFKKLVFSLVIVCSVNIQFTGMIYAEDTIKTTIEETPQVEIKTGTDITTPPRDPDDTYDTYDNDDPDDPDDTDSLIKYQY